MVRVLHVVTYMGRGGLESMIMNHYRQIDRSQLQFDFLVHRQERAAFDDEIESLGGKIYRLPRLNPFNRKYHQALRTFFEKHSYEIVHSHIDCMSSIPLKVAMDLGVSKRIAHSHNSNQSIDGKYVLKLIYKRSIPKYATDLFACGKEAGDWMYGNNQYTIVKNAIDISSYEFNEEVRLKKRNELGIEDNLVIGHVGRFRPQKNHEFIIEIFGQICKLNKTAVLLLIGDGERESNTRKIVESLNLTERVKFLGNRSDVDELVQSMDIFLFPSHFEGLPLTLVEAQTAGLPCVISDTIPEEVIVTDLVQRKSLKESALEWAETCLSNTGFERVSKRDEVAEHGFDVEKSAKWLTAFYLEQ